ncbi:MAG: hypothetical protein ACK4NE_02300 [Albidovulum sp.]
MMHDGAAVVLRLRDLLAREADLIRRGNFADLPDLAARKAGLIELLASASDGADVSALDGLRAASEANGRLLAAALRGIAAARARLAAIHAAGAGLDTYDRHGRAQRVTFAGGRVERRA